MDLPKRTCQRMLGDRICDEPATHVYHGIGGPQDVCDVHTLYLRREWGIRPTQIDADAPSTDDQGEDR